ncbi:putative inorganic diphosphatase [Helianthus annuus]|nr:putative inorganic diphosphatase [Helianthus annuus]
MCYFYQKLILVLFFLRIAGPTSFLFTGYLYVGIFMIAFAVLIFVFLGSVEGFSTSYQQCTYDTTKMCKPAPFTAVFSTVSFILGAITSVISGFLGMKIATYANARTTLEARKGVGNVCGVRVKGEESVLTGLTLFSGPFDLTRILLS